MTSVNMSPKAIENRLVVCAKLSAAHDGPLARVDMTAPAIESRLADCAEMSVLCLELRAAR